MNSFIANRLLSNIHSKSGKETRLLSLICATTVFLLLIFFQPLHYRYQSLGRVFGDALLTGGLVVMITFISRKIVVFLFQPDAKRIYSYGMQIILDVVLFLLLTFLVNLISGGFQNITYTKWLGLTIKYVFIFEAFLIPLSILLNHYFVLSSQNAVVFQKEEELKLCSSKLCLRSISKKEQLEVFPEDLIMIKSDGNYLEVYYFQNEKIRFMLLRNTITAIENHTKKYPFLLRCHRSYLINTNKIENIKGNTRGYIINLAGIEYKVPVSRSKITSFKAFLKT
ncbi:LytR/AlgR family response regulator transcription factor [Aquimarina spongiae]|uniref:Transcriptional regulator, LytTR family n=1 Tax=Aquimarina spongiae TaxID=570521 RepID=A0A1M6G0E4_9FLAO|nr:LytTR family transcriptional regulator DNA-binding domain-containing protein [Aquimarina spongiae]SHJ03423.1 transcriptional regulator, LytTR family [Aquimarina spongiae]